jgi:AraC-like DNA-binding protein
VPHLYYFAFSAFSLTFSEDIGIAQGVNHMTPNVTAQECAEQIDNILNLVPSTHYFHINEHWDLTVPAHWATSPNNPLDVTDFRLHIVRSGKGTYIINNHVMPMEKGLIMFFSPPLVYGHKADPHNPPSLISCHFELHDSKSEKRRKNPTFPFFWSSHLSSEEYEKNIPFFEKISRLYCQKQNSRHQQSLCSSAIHLLLGNIQEICLTTLDKNFDMRVEAARLHMKDNPLRAKPFEILANEAGVGTDYFARLFNKQVGVSPKRYRLQSKMEYARYLLSHGNDVQQVAEQLGYSDQFVFSRLFKRIHGEKPSSFKCSIRSRDTIS